MLLVDMAREGRGVTWAPMSLVRADLDSGRLLRAGGADWDIPISVSLFRTRARMTRAAENFWNSVRKGRPGGKSIAPAPRTR
jgi:DNA-binding transcriptional LysR family regulator